MPRFQGENFAKNSELAEHVKALAHTKGSTPSRLALAWLLAQGKDVVPIPGTSSIARLEENAEATVVTLTASDLKRLESLAPQGGAVGERYPPAMLELVNR